MSHSPSSNPYQGSSVKITLDEASTDSDAAAAPDDFDVFRNVDFFKEAFHPDMTTIAGTNMPSYFMSIGRF